MTKRNNPKTNPKYQKNHLQQSRFALVVMKPEHEEAKKDKAKQNLAALHFKDISQCRLYQKSYHEQLMRGGRGKTTTISLLN